MADRAAIDMFLDRAKAFFNRRLRIDAVQVVKVDVLGLQPAQALRDFRMQYFRPAATGAAVSAFGRNDALCAARRQRRADGVLAFALGIQMCRVDHTDTGSNGFLYERDVPRRSGKAVRAQADTGDRPITDFQIHINTRFFTTRFTS